MGDKKDEALYLIKELIGATERLHSESLAETGRLMDMRSQLEDLQEIVTGLDVCQCDHG